MDKDCTTFENNYTKVKNNNHNNNNQKEGRKVILLLILFFLSLGLLFIKKYRKYLIFVSLSIFSLLVLYIYLDPIRIMRLADYIINSNVKTPPKLDIETYFPNYKYLEEKTSIFQKELEELLRKTDNGKKIPKSQETIVKFRDDEGWKVYQIKLGKHIIETAKTDFPELVNTIKKYPEIINAFVSILEGKSKISMHTGYYKGIVRYMLPLKVPKDKENCFLCVNGEKHVWEEGKSILWDDNFPHKVYNHTDETRIVIFIDVLRLKLDWKREKFNNLALSLMNETSIIKNEIKKTEIKQKIE